MLKIVFMGTPQFSVPILEAIITHYPNTIVFSKPDKIRGRGRKKSPSPVKEIALKHNLEVHTPTTKEDLSEEVQKIQPDLIIVVAYAMILPKKITDNYTCINIHASLLPNYRGASPIHSALLNNDKKTGITLIQMNEKMDEGDILKIEELSIQEDDNLATLEDKLSTISSKLICEYISTLNISKHPILLPNKVKQDHDKASYCKKIQKEDLELKLSDTIQTNFAKIRAFSPKPGAFIIQNNQRIKVLKANIENEKLVPIIIKPEGKKEMMYKDYLLGQKEEIKLC